MKLDVVLHQGMQFKAHDLAGATVNMDADAKHGGKGEGFQPLELMLASLAGCTGMDVISILRKKRQDVRGYHVEVRAEQADEYPKVFTQIALVHVVEGPDISPEAVRRAIELSEEKYCPAYAMLKQAVAIGSSFEIRMVAGGG